MLKKVQKNVVRKDAGNYVIVAAQYNAQYVDSMLAAAQNALREAGAARIDVVRVPGSFEIPVVAAKIARKRAGLAGILCLGVIIQGETAHAQLIGEAVSHSLAQLQVQIGIPIVHAVLLLKNEAQAKVRCLNPEHNRGLEAAHTALAMAKIMREL